MKHFFLKLITFIALFFFVDVVMGYGLKTLNLGVKKGDYGRNSYIMTEMKGKDVLVFGSSRAIHHYDPGILSDSLGLSCYNCGEDGMGIVLSYARLNAILERYTPKVILYDVEASFDIMEGDNCRYLGRLNLFYPDYGLERLYDDVSETEKFKMISQLYRYNSQAVDMAIQRISTSSEYAKDYTFSPLSGILNYRPQPPLDRVVVLDTLKKKYFESFISTCKKNDIILLFAVSPKYQNRSNGEVSALIDLCASYKLPLLNHFCDTTYNLHRELFEDPKHLNKIGADLYSRTISSELKTYMAIQKVY